MLLRRDEGRCCELTGAEVLSGNQSKAGGGEGHQGLVHGLGGELGWAEEG